jgi:hypothetical protein
LAALSMSSRVTSAISLADNVVMLPVLPSRLVA